jgi:hypothetical protein
MMALYLFSVCLGTSMSGAIAVPLVIPFAGVRTPV